MLSNEEMAIAEKYLFMQVIAPIEVYLKPEMTDLEKTRAKINSYESVKKAIKEFCQEKNIEEEEIIFKVKNWMANRINKNNQMQYSLVNDMLDNMLPQKDEAEKTYGNA